AFNFYKEVFGTEFQGEIHRMSDVPANAGYPGPSEEEKNLVMHVTLPILAGHLLMGTDVPESAGLQLVMGNNVSINLEPDTREEVDQLFQALSAGGSVEVAPQEMFWGDYFAACADKFGI